jgi:hypothetical protein
MSEKQSEAMECRFVGRLGCEPEAQTRGDGAMVCRLVLTSEAKGPASSPPRVGVYITGGLARRCRNGLHEGDLVEVLACPERWREGGRVGVKFPEFAVEDAFENVKLKQRAGVAA